MGPTVMGFWGTKGYPLAGNKKFYCSGGSSNYYIYYDGEFTWFDVHLNKLKSGKYRSAFSPIPWISSIPGKRWMNNILAHVLKKKWESNKTKL